jgi:hypothetical protein
MTSDNLVERLNLFVTCGCGDDEWPQLRFDTVAALDAKDSHIEKLQAALLEAGARECSSWCDRGLNEHTSHCKRIRELINTHDGRDA